MTSEEHEVFTVFVSFALLESQGSTQIKVWAAVIKAGRKSNRKVVVQSQHFNQNVSCFVRQLHE